MKAFPCRRRGLLTSRVPGLFLFLIVLAIGTLPLHAGNTAPAGGTVNFIHLAEQG